MIKVNSDYVVDMIVYVVGCGDIFVQFVCFFVQIIYFVLFSDIKIDVGFDVF